MKTLKKSQGLLKKMPRPGNALSLSQTVTNILIGLGFKVSTPTDNELDVSLSISLPGLCKN